VAESIWMLLIGCLLIIELRSLSTDRIERDKQALADRAAQDKSFKDVRTAQDSDFQATANGLTAAISGIQSTLKTADTTLIQTRPHAAIRFDRVEFADGMPAEIKSNTPYSLNFYYVNGGAETAVDIKILPQIYVAKADDKEAQIQLSRQFENTWNLETSQINSPSVLVPDILSFGTTDRIFTKAEVGSMNKDGTIYYLIRFEYSDGTGRWRTDKCGFFQRTAAVNRNVFHTCSVFQRFRYAVKQHH
jgi:hypothetical protein